MRFKSEKTRLKEGRCLQPGSAYVGFIKANEAHSTGVAVQIHDPISNRTVDVLSQCEKKWYMIFRFNSEVDEIYEQYRLDTSVIHKIQTEKGYPLSTHSLTTDFLVKYKDKHFEAFSIKDSASFRNPASYKDPARFLAAQRRFDVERLYWEQNGIAFKELYGDEVNPILAKNISTLMHYYSSDLITTDDTESMLKYLMAHQYITFPMEKDYLNFKKLLCSTTFDIKSMFLEAVYGNKQPQFS